MASHLIWLLLCSIFSFICGVAAAILFHLKPRRTSSSSSSTATCPPDSAAPSSSSFYHPQIKYDVFLSFRGTDTRSGFLSHLLKELSRKKIDYFVDDQKLKQGDEISSTLLNAIKKSQISLVVFSKDYADSKWCLKELEQIIHCRENQNQIVVPVFYQVDPSTVRHQIGSYKDAFVKHGKRFDQYRLQKWKTALDTAANLSGFDSSNYKTEETLVEEIVKRLLTTLNHTGDQTRDQNDLKDFVGIHEHIQYLEPKLDTKSQDIFIIGLWGMGGVGKTTIAEILYNRLYNKYEGSCFLRVRDELDEKRSIVRLKMHLLSKLLNEDLHDILLSNIPTYVERRLFRKKVLVILDDITDSNQLKILTGGHKWFGLGSRIVMTSRDKNVFSKECDEIYPIQPLNFEEALQLLEIVLRKDCPHKKQEHCELSKKIVKYAKGVPLAIKVLGCYLYDKEKDVWKSILEKLEKKAHVGIQKVLELSYDGLDDDEHKDIFLYLSCFFGPRESKERIIMLLDACGYHTIDGLRILQDKALVTSTYGFVSMHELIQVMGREIVHKGSPKNPSQRNHLWDVDDICEVLTKKRETRSIESIRLRMCEPKKDIQLGPQAFASMDNLRLLQFDNGFMIYPPKEEGFESLPSELRCFIWNGCPLKTFPSRFCVENLVELRFRNSKFRKLWDGVQDLPNLKVICLNWSSKLTEVPDLSKAPNLRSVHLLGCCKLRYFGLQPHHNIVELDSNEYNEHKKISIEESMEDDHLDVCGTPLPIKPSYKYYVFSSLRFLDLGYCTGFVELPNNIDLYLPSLQGLGLLNTNVKAIPASIKHLSHLTELEISHCNLLQYIPELPPTVKYIKVHGCRSLETIQFASNSMPLSHRHKLIIDLYGCVKLDDHALRAVAWYFKFTIQRMISASIKDGYASLGLPRSKIPKLFDDRYYKLTHDSRSFALILPLHSEVMGFIFFFALFEERKGLPIFVEIRCHIAYLSDIELRNNVPALKGYVQFTYYPEHLRLWSDYRDHVSFWYDGSLDLKITEELSRIKASADTIDDLCALVWFELLENKLERLINIKEWAVYSNCALGFHDTRFL